MAAKAATEDVIGTILVEGDDSENEEGAEESDEEDEEGEIEDGAAGQYEEGEAVQESEDSASASGSVAQARLSWARSSSGPSLLAGQLSVCLSACSWSVSLSSVSLSSAC
jgi:hypothetical protein